MKTVKTTVLALFIVCLVSMVVASPQILKPSDHVDEVGETVNPGNAYDFPNSYDESSFAETTISGSDPSITFDQWETSSQPYSSLNLSVTAEVTGNTDNQGDQDSWGYYYSVGGVCDSTANAIQPLTVGGTAFSNFTVSINPDTDLSQLEVCIVDEENTAGNTDNMIQTYDVRTVGEVLEPPKWFNLSQSSNKISEGDMNQLSLDAESDIELGQAVLETNETGVSENRTEYGSPQLLEGTEGQPVFDWQNPDIDNGFIEWRVWINDTEGQYNVTDLKSFEVDSTKPSVSIFSPQNQVFGEDSVSLEVGSDKTITEWRYNLDQQGNITFEPNTTLEDMEDGTRELEVWARDEVGNWGSETRSFTVDTEPPVFDEINERFNSPTTYEEEREYSFNTTVLDQTETVVDLEFDGQNYTVNEIEEDVYESDIGVLDAGVYSYRWYAEDEAGNTNTTEVQTYEVEKAAVDTDLYINGSRGDRVFEYGESANLSVDINTSEEVELWDDISGQFSRRDSGLPLLQSILELDFDLGTYDIRGVFFGTQNYQEANETHQLEIIDETPPVFSNVGSDVEGRMFRGEEVVLSALWEDNYETDRAVLNLNESGVFENKSVKSIPEDGQTDFSYELPFENFPGVLGWRQYGNDTSGNYNRTGTRSFEVWGYSESYLELNTTTISTGESVEARCFTRETNTSSHISGYDVEIINGTVSVDTGVTDSSGWYNTTLQFDEAQDDIPVECSIEDDEENLYAAEFSDSVDLTVNVGDPPRLKDGFYSLNTTDLEVGESLQLSAQWEDELDHAYIEYDTLEQGEKVEDLQEAPFTQNYTNFTLETAGDWFKGTHSIKLYANDSHGNLNDTLETKEFNLTGFSAVEASGPDKATRNDTRLEAVVTDLNSSEPVEDYEVEFFSQGEKIGENSTDSNGLAVYNWDTSDMEIGDKEFNVSIEDKQFFKADTDQSSRVFTLKGLLEPDAYLPEGELVRGETYSLEADVLTDRDEAVEPDNATWYNSLEEKIGSERSDSWTVPIDYPTGQEELLFNASKELYEDGEDFRNVEIYGRSNVTEFGFTENQMDEGESTEFVCRIQNQEGLPIENYDVVFENETQQVRTVSTNSTGWASITIQKEDPGEYVYSCEITDDRDLFYKASEPVRQEKTLEVNDITPPSLVEKSPSDGFEKVKQEELVFNSTWEDNYELSSLEYSINDSGSFTNRTVEVSGEEDFGVYSFTNTSFRGELAYRVYGTDTSDNVAVSETRQGIVNAVADLSSLDTSDAIVSPGTEIETVCNVQDNLTEEPVPGYDVGFYVDGSLEDEGTTSEDGNASFSYSEEEEGESHFECRIEPDEQDFYLTDTETRDTTVEFRFGEQSSSKEGIRATEGVLEGSKDSLGQEGVGWDFVADPEDSFDNRLEIDLRTDAPRYTVEEIIFEWDLSRIVRSFPESVNDPGGSGEIFFTGDGASSTWFYDDQYAVLEEEQQGNHWEFEPKGFDVYLPEDETADYSSLELEIDINATNKPAEESLQASLYDFAEENQYECGEFTEEQRTNFTCTVDDGTKIPDLMDGNRVVVDFEDTYRENDDVQTSWYIKRLTVNSEYQNPGDPAYSYSLGGLSDGGPEQFETVSPSGQLETVNGSSALEPTGYISVTGDYTGFLSFDREVVEEDGTYWEHGFSVDDISSNVSYDVGSVESYSTSIKDEDGEEVEARIQLFDQGELYREVSSGESVDLAKDRLYDIRQSIDDNGEDYNVTFYDYNVSETVAPETQLLEKQDMPLQVNNLSKIYATEDIEDYEQAELRVPKGEEAPDTIVKCGDWDFGQSECAGEWNAEPVDEYETTETETHFVFNTTSFSAFGTGNGEPLPNLTNIQISDVTDLSTEEKRTEGEVLDEGTNKTFDIDQEKRDREYRFSFRIRNDGTQDWEIQSEDELLHESIDQDWRVQEAFYNITDPRFGFSFENGRLDWDTSNGDTLEAGEIMNASYIVSSDLTEPKTYDQSFLVNVTSDNAGSKDEHKLNITKYGFLSLDVITPPSPTTVQKDNTFLFNTSTECKEGICGEVTVEPRYNESEEPDTVIPETEDTPFYSIGSNTRNCGEMENEDCIQEWEINATGELETSHLIDHKASSDEPKTEANNSESVQININQAMLIDVTWDKLDFGVLEPGVRDRPAIENDMLTYNVSVDSNSLTVENLSVRSTDLDSEEVEDRYFIDAENISYSKENDHETGDSLKNTYQQLAQDVSPGTDVTTYYWINVPNGIKSAEYNGTIFFKADEQ